MGSCIKNVGLILIVLSIVACDNRAKNVKEPIVQEESIIDQKMINRMQLADSTVSLSFSGVTLSSHINTIYRAQKEGKIKIGRKTNDSIFCSAALYYNENKDPIDVNLSIGYFEDTITGFNVISRDYDSREAVKSLYANKYNIDFAETANYGRTPYIWTFNNQILRIDEKSYVEEVIYIKNPKMKMPENKYGTKRTTYFDKIIISYIDIRQNNKLTIYKAQQENKSRLKAQRADSIKKAKNKANMAKQEI